RKDEWKISGVIAETPALTDHSVCLVSTSQVPAKAKASIQLLLGDKSGEASFVFAYRGPGDFLAMTLAHTGPQSRCIVSHWNGQGWKPLLEKDIRFLP